MAVHSTGLGKGLDALIRESSEPHDPASIRTLRLDDIVPNPRQPRREFSEKSLEELAASIKSQGILQPLLVRPVGSGQPGKYEIVAGERRWRASRLAGLVEAPVFVRSFSQQDTLAAALIENLQREDLNPIEEAQGIQVLKEEFGLSQDDLAVKIGKSRSAIANSLRLLSLGDESRKLLAEGRISPGHARALLSVTDAKAREELQQKIVESRLTVREAEGLAATWKATGRFTPDAEAKTTARERPRDAMPRSERMVRIQNTFAELYQVPVKVSGKENKGKISFAYSSPEELDALLQRLSANALPGSEHQAIAGRNSAMLDSRTLAELDGVTREALGREQREVLSGQSHEQLPTDHKAPLAGADRPLLAGADHAFLAGQKAGVLAGPPVFQAIAATDPAGPDAGAAEASEAPVPAAVGQEGDGNAALLVGSESAPLAGSEPAASVGSGAADSADGGEEAAAAEDAPV